MGRTIQQMLEDMRASIDSAVEDAAKCDNGNKAAGTRVRKAMQHIKAKAQEVRKAVTDRAPKKGE